MIKNNDYKKLIREDNKLLSKINEKLDDDPILNIFTKKKYKRRYLLKFILSFFMIIIILILASLFLYKDKTILDRIFDILGNGFYWIISSYLYLFVSHFIDKLMNRSVSYEKRY